MRGETADDAVTTPGGSGPAGSTPPLHLIYFSSATLNTHRFVEKLGLPASRIPLLPSDPPVRPASPYVLIVPTYGGGASINGRRSPSIPRQVLEFLREPGNRALARGVIGAGNTNFGIEYCLAAKKISAKLGIPLLYRFELMGTAEDVRDVRAGLRAWWPEACGATTAGAPAEYPGEHGGCTA